MNTQIKESNNNSYSLLSGYCVLGTVQTGSSMTEEICVLLFIHIFKNGS